jgi:hypothetical protein
MIFDVLTYSIIAIALILTYVIIRLTRSDNKS